MLSDSGSNGEYWDQGFEVAQSLDLNNVPGRMGGVLGLQGMHNGWPSSANLAMLTGGLSLTLMMEENGIILGCLDEPGSKIDDLLNELETAFESVQSDILPSILIGCMGGINPSLYLFVSLAI